MCHSAGSLIFSSTRLTSDVALSQILDDPTAFGLSQDWEDRFVLRRLLTSYSQRADIIPPTLFLDGVRCEDKETLEIGGYADIFQAKHEGELVALKRLRISMVSKENQSYRKVSSTYLKVKVDLSNHL